MRLLDSRRNLRLFVLFLLICIAAAPTAQAGEDLRQPNAGDRIATTLSLGGWLGLELFKERIGPITPNYTEPNRLDATVRHATYRHNERGRKLAARFSDALLYGLYLPAAVALPIAVEDDPRGAYNAIAQTTSINGITTNLMKFTVARERPYKTFGTDGSQGVDDNLSFISGHTSHAFALAIASGLLLRHAHPDRAAAIWPTALLPAAVIGYLRVAADRHYLTDVIAGAVVGTATGFLVATGWDRRLVRNPQAPLLAKISFPF